MNKTAIKNFAVNARRKLMEQVQQKAFTLGITEEKVKKAQILGSDAVTVNGELLDNTQRKQRDKLIKETQEKGYQQVMEEVAYTWFNRFIALRFMEVNEYLPTEVRVLSSSDPERKEPDIIRKVLEVDLPLDRELVYQFQDNNDLNGLFKYLLIQQCNALNEILPFLFEKLVDYTEILLPDNLLNEGSVVRELVESIEEEDWKEGVEIIGWLYQYYISEKKDEVFANLKKNIKISKENIPAATQLFTPKWIVQYMVENSLGRLWLESHPSPDLQAQWKYYLEEAEQEPEVQQQLEEIRQKNINPEEIKVLDPACGSGHILVYAFDVLYEIYKSAGYIEKDIPKLILEKNLYGLDIDDRAEQLACFAVMMKAREKSRRIFRSKVELNICAIQESNGLKEEILDVLLGKSKSEQEQAEERERIEYLLRVFFDAKEYGSILTVEEKDWRFLEERLEQLEQGRLDLDLLSLQYKETILETLPRLTKQARIMSAEYDVVVTNPPYMGSKGMNEELSKFVKASFPDSKSDLFAVFIEKCSKMTKLDGLQAMITMQSWMFLSSYEVLRRKIINRAVISLVQVGYNSFPELNSKVVQAVAFILNRGYIKNYKGSYLDLNTNYPQFYGKEQAFLKEKSNPYHVTAEGFLKIPGSPIAYWVSNRVKLIFENAKKMNNYADIKKGMSTANDDYFLKLWHEIDISKAALRNLDLDKKWFPITKGGSYRKWYGNNEHIVNWSNNGQELKQFKNAVIRNEKYYFKEGITWTYVTTGKFSSRYCKGNFLFTAAGPMVFTKCQYYLLAIMNSKLFQVFLRIIGGETITYEVGELSNIPIVVSDDTDRIKRIEDISKENIGISCKEWDQSENSWDFKQHPLLTCKDITIQQAFRKWTAFAENQFYQLKANEEELNRIFIEIYGLQDELTPEVEEKDVTVRKADRERDIKSFISYAVGCMLGRYSLDQEGLIFAGGEFDKDKYKTFPADEDGILPITEDEYFDDDIVAKFVQFVKVTFGEDTLGENLEYIAETLGKKASETARQCIRRYFLKEFYKDHVQIYKKRPIYWLFTSGKEGAFNALIYLHRYDKGTVSRVRTDYLHELQDKMEAEKNRLIQLLEIETSPKERKAAQKKLTTLEKQMKELVKYDEVIHHLADQQIELDLDDGVVVNYAKLQPVLAKI